MHEKIRDYIYTNKQKLLSLLDELVAVQSVMGEPERSAPFGSGPRAALDKMVNNCRSEGFDTRLCCDAVGTADLCPGNSDEPPALGILCHLDVVPAAGQEGWNTDPFKLTEKDGVLYGRGVIDDKGPLAAAFFAMKCVRDLKIPLKKGVRLIFGTNEENGSDDLKLYTEKEKLPANVFTPDAAFPVINIEKGMLRLPFRGKHSCKGGSIMSFHGGNIPNAVPDKAECVLAGIPIETIVDTAKLDSSGAKFEIKPTNVKNQIKIECIGRSAHASTPESGINAVTALIGLLCGLPLASDKKNDRQREMLRGLNWIFPCGETDGMHAGLKMSDEKSGALTLVFSIFNIENGKCSGCTDIRFPVSASLDEITRLETAALEKAGFTPSEAIGDEPHITDENSEFVQKLLKVYERCENEKGRCIAIGGGTYVHNVPGGVAFGVERGDTDYHLHGANEFITTDELLRDAVIMAEAIVEICG
ncbi:MAG: Sapep family Mn(2+)-dependent dipeptidase [Ruminiclostridium sp.]|nr:Sapep family Mn(2+)-dependent dipeptidase [Ruminiclostridium sp.]